MATSCVCWSLAAVLLLLQVAAAAGVHQPFKSLRSPRETVEQYEVHTPVVRGQGKTSEGHHPESLDLQISNYSIHLELNSGLISPSFTSHSFDEDKNDIVVDKGHVNCFYHGRVEGRPEWHAVMSTCHGVHGSFGKVGSGDEYYHVEPLDRDNPEIEQPHVLYTANKHSAELETCGVSSRSGPPHSPSHLPDHVQVDRNRVKRLVNGRYVVEWAIINDLAQYETYERNLSATVLRALELANFVDERFLTLNIRVIVVHAMTWTSGDRIQYPSDNNPNLLLDRLQDYEPQITAPHDSTMLITGVDIQGSTVGIAFVGTMCRGRSSVGLSQDGGRNLQSSGSTVAHELGHIFNMNHDDGRQCTCADDSGSCIMSAVSGFPAPLEWSSCSRSDLDDGFRIDNLNNCLGNPPSVTVGDPVCGNGIREGDEICDCGSVEECQDPCCNATACMLVEGAQCFSGACCTEQCRFVPLGTTCRAPAQECDIEEYCSGDASTCPQDLQKQDSTPCNGDEDYCFGGLCRTHDSQCQRYFGTDKGRDICYTDVNTMGDQFGNCGASQGAFVPCSAENVECGQLQCNGGQFTNQDGASGLTILRFTIGGVPCHSFTTGADSDTPSPGLVADGTRCGSGNGSVCISQECALIADLDFIVSCPVGDNGQTCAGSGVCNNLNRCSCVPGLGGDTCEEEVGRPVGGANAGAIAGGVIGAILGILLAIGIAVGVVFLVMKYRSKRDKAYLPRPKRTTPTTGVSGRVKPLTGSQSNLVDDGPTSVEVKPAGRSYKPPPVRQTPSTGKSQPPPPSNAVPPPPSRKDAPLPPRSGPTPRRPPPAKAPPPRTPQPPGKLKPTSAPPPKPVPATKKPPPAAPKPGKISAQWPPPDSTGPKKPVYPPPRH